MLIGLVLVCNEGDRKQLVTGSGQDTPKSKERLVSRPMPCAAEKKPTTKQEHTDCSLVLLCSLSYPSCDRCLFSGSLTSSYFFVFSKDAVEAGLYVPKKRPKGAFGKRQTQGRKTSQSGRWARGIWFYIVGRK